MQVWDKLIVLLLNLNLTLYLDPSPITITKFKKGDELIHSLYSPALCLQVSKVK